MYLYLERCNTQFLIMWSWNTGWRKINTHDISILCTFTKKICRIDFFMRDLFFWQPYCWSLSRLSLRPCLFRYRSLSAGCLIRTAFRDLIHFDLQIAWSTTYTVTNLINVSISAPTGQTKCTPAVPRAWFVCEKFSEYHTGEYNSRACQ